MKSLTELGTRLYAKAAARRQKGATIIEYVLLVSLIAVALVAAGAFSGVVTAIQAAFTSIAGYIN